MRARFEDGMVVWPVLVFENYVRVGELREGGMSVRWPTSLHLINPDIQKII